EPSAEALRDANPYRMAMPQTGLTVEGSVMGTPSFMPPEQAKGVPVDERADVYSLGAILYFLLSGATPYEGTNSRAVLMAVATKEPVPLEERQPGVPKDLLAITKKAMAREAGERYPHAGALTEDLKKFQTGQIVGAYEYSRFELFRR